MDCVQRAGDKFHDTPIVAVVVPLCNMPPAIVEIVIIMRLPGIKWSLLGVIMIRFHS